MAADGSALKVRIEQIHPFGLTVALSDGRKGVVRSREIARGEQDGRTWAESFQVDQFILVVPLGVREDGVVELSLRQAEGDPWLAFGNRYRVGSLINGIVVNVQPYGLFVELL